MSRKPKITVVGSYNTDLAVRTPRMPVRGETIIGEAFMTGPGGKGANQAVAASRLGAEVTMVVKLGHDLYGDLAQENLVKEGINTDYLIRTADTHTGVAFIIIDKEGENMIVVAAGANEQLTPQEVLAAQAGIASADVLLLELEVPIQSVEQAARVARQAGVKVVLNPAPGMPLSRELLGMIDVLTPNQTETQIITGMSVGDIDQAQLAARQLLDEGVGTVVITLGADGAMLATPSGMQHVPGQKVEVVDSTGAGDAFNGALAVALAEGVPLPEAVAFANAAAALQVTRLGTAPAMPYRSEVHALLARA